MSLACGISGRVMAFLPSSAMRKAEATEAESMEELRHI